MKDILSIDPMAQVLMISSIEQKHIMDDAIKSGAKGYVRKPFDKNEITHALQEILK